MNEVGFGQLVFTNMYPQGVQCLPFRKPISQVSFQFTRPTEGRDITRFQPKHRLSDFNSRAHAERDLVVAP